MAPQPNQINPELNNDAFGHTFLSTLYLFPAISGIDIRLQLTTVRVLYKTWQLRHMTIKMHQMSSTVNLQSRDLRLGCSQSMKLVWKAHHMLLTQAFTNQNAGSGRIGGNGGLHPRLCLDDDSRLLQEHRCLATCLHLLSFLYFIFLRRPCSLNFPIMTLFSHREHSHSFISASCSMAQG
jgi:hypothetical protein